MTKRGVPEAPTYRRWRWPVFIATLLCFFLLWVPAFVNPMLVAFTGPFQVPYLIILWRFYRRPPEGGLGLAGAWGVFMCVATVLCGLDTLYAAKSTDMALLVIYVGAVALAQAGLAASALKALSMRAHETGSRRTLWWSLGSATVLVILTFIAAALIRDLRRSRLTFANESSAIGSVARINSCAASFAQAHPDVGYPESLQQMGPGGEECLDEALASGVKDGYRFTYLPGTLDVSGRRTYAISARPTAYERTGTKSFFSDAPGLIHWTKEDRPAGAQDPPL